MDLKITSLIEAMYDNVEHAFIVNGQLIEWFRVKTGVRHGYLLSPVLFSLFLEFVTADLQSLCKEFKLDLIFLTRLPPKAKAQMASGQGSHWLIESPTVLLYV